MHALLKVILSFQQEKIINFVENKESELLSPKVFHFVQNSLQFSCRDVSDGWSVVPTDGEEVSIYQHTTMAVL